MGGVCSTQGAVKNVYKTLLSKVQGKPLVRSRHRWDENIKIGAKQIWYEDVGWIKLLHATVWWWAFVNRVMNLHVI
jgi:hypothetical protein